MTTTYLFQCMWPVLDDGLTLRELAEEAHPEMVRRAAHAGAVLVGRPEFALGMSLDGPVLTGKATATPRPGGGLVVRLPGQRPVDAPEAFTEPPGMPVRPVPVREPRERKANAAVAECGTEGGYFRHRRTTKTPVCDPCREARNKAEVERVAARRAERENVAYQTALAEYHAAVRDWKQQQEVAS